MENREYYLAQLTVYQYDKKKIKCDYSVIPLNINLNKSPITAKSGVSEEIIDLKGFTFNKYFTNFLYAGSLSIDDEPLPLYIASKYEKKKEGDARKVSVVYISDDLEKDDVLFRNDLKKRFKNKFIFKRKYINFLNKKENLNQL